MHKQRYRRIILFFARVIVSLFFWDILLPRLGLRKFARKSRSRRLRQAAIRFRTMAIDLGGVMIKVGQFLSTRVDVLPTEITVELSGLQDEVPPVKFEDIKRIAEAELDSTLEQKYAFFNPIPIAAASLGQVHSARLWLKSENDESTQSIDVVVKIQRPQISEIIEIDLAALGKVGDWLQQYKPIRRRVDIEALLLEFSRILHQEVDYIQEGSHAETFASNFQEIPGVRVPRVVWSHTTTRVLTLEDVRGIKINDYEEINLAGVDRGEVASRLIDVYLKQIFNDGFFHADPHPGNLFVKKLENELWELTFVDFGMVGHVPDNTRFALREMMIGVGTQDAARVVRSYQLLGLLLPTADIKLLEQAEARLFERFWGKSMGELQQFEPSEIAELTMEFRELLYTMPFQIPQNIIFLVRTISILSGMCTSLDTNFNIWHHLIPYAEQLVTEEISGKGAEDWLKNIGDLIQRLAQLPIRADSVLDRIEHGELIVRDIHLEQQIRQIRSALNAICGSIIFAALFYGMVQFYLEKDLFLATASSLLALLTLIFIVRHL